MRENFYGSISPQPPNSENRILICFEIKCAFKQTITQFGINHCLQINDLAHQWGNVHMTQQHSKKCVEDMFHMQMFSDLSDHLIDFIYEFDYKLSNWNVYVAYLQTDSRITFLLLNV